MGVEQQMRTRPAWLSPLTARRSVPTAREALTCDCGCPFLHMGILAAGAAAKPAWLEMRGRPHVQPLHRQVSPILP